MTDLDWVPQSCTLPTEEQPLRMAEWDGLLSERLTALSRPRHLEAGCDDLITCSASSCCPIPFTDLAEESRHAGPCC